MKSEEFATAEGWYAAANSSFFTLYYHSLKSNLPDTPIEKS
jgi:hypothetical protein